VGRRIPLETGWTADERLLLIEDDASIREIVSIGLKAAGFRVVTAIDGLQGLASARSGGFDAVILDVMLPLLDGFEVCREIITVQNPAIGEQVSSPATVSGTADVFEAVVSVRILDSAGNQIARTFSTASCGTGCRGGYSIPVSYTVTRAEPGTIEVFESSPKNGQPVNVQLIPVTLAP
jgi:CheY-like chemotaxis protein